MQNFTKSTSTHKIFFLAELPTNCYAFAPKKQEPINRTMSQQYWLDLYYIELLGLGLYMQQMFRYR